MSNKDNTARSIGEGIGMAIGVIIRSGFRLGLLWLGLWVLNYFNWLPF